MQWPSREWMLRLIHWQRRPLCGGGGPRLPWDPDVQHQSQTPAGQGCPPWWERCISRWRVGLCATSRESLRFFSGSSRLPCSADPCAATGLRAHLRSSVCLWSLRTQWDERAGSCQLQKFPLAKEKGYFGPTSFNRPLCCHPSTLNIGDL